MTTKHTKGPWEMPYSPNMIGSQRVDGTWELIAETCGENRIANAVLISAAPELLGALSEIIDHATRYGAAPLSAVKMFDRARAAIAKAEGRG